jgi:hypothetical protein
LRTLLLLVALSLFGSSYAITVQLSLKHFFGNESLVLNSKTYVLLQGDSLSITRLKYYIGNIKLTYVNGSIYSDQIKYHLVDLEQVESLVMEFDELPEGQLKNISFSIGVDSLTNSNGLMDGDLDPLKGMYWAWSSGFINFKLEGIHESCQAKKEFTYHIGGFIAPNASFQVKSIPLNQKVSTEKVWIEMNVDIKGLFSDNKILDLHKIMSPSKKAKEFSAHLPQLFSIEK